MTFIELGSKKERDQGQESHDKNYFLTQTKMLSSDRKVQYYHHHVCNSQLGTTKTSRFFLQNL